MHLEPTDDRSTRSRVHGPVDGHVVQARDIDGGIVQVKNIHEAAESVVVPRQLPLDVANFTGRATEMSLLDQVLHEQELATPTAIISAIAGGPGIGKTALALRWAHRVSERFPDGQLYVNLRGYGPDRPLDPNEVLRDFLRSLGIAPSKIPADVDAKSALYRSLLNGRRVLVLLDNAATTDQVWPLLPGSSTCVVAVTSRSRLSGLVAGHGARRVRLGMLSADDAAQLLRQIIGNERADREPEMVSALSELCSRLPLALRIAGERVAAYPHVALSDLVGELADERRRLDTFDSDDGDALEVRAAFSWSYEALRPENASVFRLLGLHASGELSIEAAAALVGTTVQEVTPRVNSLIDSHLLEQVNRRRYRFHDLLRLYALECAQSEEEATARKQAVHRCLLWYLHTADAANRVLMPQRRKIMIDPALPNTQPLSFSDHQAALTWCDNERNHLVAGTRQAAEYGIATIAWQIPVVLWSFFSYRKLIEDWISTHETGIAAARRAGERKGEAWTLNSLGNAYREIRNYEVARECWRQALTIRREIGDRYGEGTSLNNLAGAELGLGHCQDAIQYSQAALSIHQQIGDKWNEGIDLNSLGNAYLELGSIDRAIDCWRAALEIQQDIGDRYGEAKSLNHLGEAFHIQQLYPDAVTHLQKSLVIRRRLGARYDEAVTLANLGRTWCSLGILGTARDHYAEALSIFEEIGDAKAATTMDLLEALDQMSERLS